MTIFLNGFKYTKSLQFSTFYTKRLFEYKINSYKHKTKGFLVVLKLKYDK